MNQRDFLPFLLLFFALFNLNAQNKETADYWVKRANETTEPNLAITYYSSAIELAPTNQQIYIWRGIVKKGIGKYNAAISDFDSAIVFKPANELALSLRGDTYVRLKKYDLATRDLKSTLEINPANQLALADLGEINRLQQKRPEAKDYFLKAVKAAPRYDFALVRLADSYLNSGQLDSAIYYATEAITVNNINDWAWQIRGEAYLKQNQSDKALDDFKTAVAKNPLSVQAHVLLAKALRNQKNIEEALNKLYDALELEPGNKETQKLVAAYEKQTKYRPLRPKPKVQLFRTGLTLVEQAPPPLETRPKMTFLAGGGKLPAFIDLSPFFSFIRMQGGQNSCVGFAIAYLAAYLEKKETGKNALFSPAFIYNQGNQGFDNGMQFSAALSIWKASGICLENAMPYSDLDYRSYPSETAKSQARKYRIQNSYEIWTLEELKYQLFQENPVLISVVCDESLIRLKEKPWNTLPGGMKAMGHAMLVVGYDDDKKAIKVLNSWGRTWGENGFGWISYEIFDKVRRQMFVVKDAVNIEESTADYTSLLEHFKTTNPTPAPGPNTTPGPNYNFGTPAVMITGGVRNPYDFTLSITGFTTIPALSGYVAQITVYYYDANGLFIASQMFPYTTYTGQACVSTNPLNIPFFGLYNLSWWTKTPSVVFPPWYQSGAPIIAEPVLFIDGFPVAVGPRVQM